MSCEQVRKEYEGAVEAHDAAVRAMKRQEAMLFGGTSPAPLLLSDQDLEALRRVEAEEQETARLEREKAAAYEVAKRSHQDQ